MFATRSTRTRLLGLLIIALILISSVPAAAAKPPAAPDFGPNVLVFDPSMPTAEIQAAVDAVYAQQVDNEMGAERYALLFKPGVYGSAEQPLFVKVGYYTEVAGLGVLPTDVTINGHVDVYNRCLTPDNCIALVNFWRSLSNLTIAVNGTGLDGCRASGNFWAVSQAAPMRRVDVTSGHLTLMDYCTGGPQYASGGFIADTQTAAITSGSQQQFMVRDSSIGSWSNGVWNMVFSGVEGAPANSFGPTPYDPPPYTTLETSPLTREKPFLYMDADGAYHVFVPVPRQNSRGASWADGPTAGESLPISSFFIAKPSDSARAINTALAQGRNLIFSPGVYHLDRPLVVRHANTVVLGLGLPTLIPENGIVAMQVTDVPGVKLAGVMFDAGPVESPVLLQVGTQRAWNSRARENNNWSDPANPTLLADIFIRVGGAAAGLPDDGTTRLQDMKTLKLLFEKQLEYYLGLAALLAVVLYFSRFPGVSAGELWGLRTPFWLWLSVGEVILQHGLAWFVLRTELHLGLMKRWFGRRAFITWAVPFVILLVLRFVVVILVAISNRGAWDIPPVLAWGISVMILAPALYTFYSIKKYFTFKRAMAIDHFDPAFRGLGLVRQGIYRYTPNAMYTFAISLVWIPALVFGSPAALLSAFFSHASLWLMYYTLEQPNMRRIYGDKPV